MSLLASIILILVLPSIMCLFGFFVGRCSRKLPIIDDNLPWTMHRGHMIRTNGNNQTIANPESYQRSGLGS